MCVDMPGGNHTHYMTDVQIQVVHCTLSVGSHGKAQSGSRQLLQAGSGCLTEAFLFIFSQST